MTKILIHKNVNIWQFLLITFFTIKLLLDFFTEYRELGFIITNAVLYALLFVFFYLHKKITISKNTMIEASILVSFLLVQLYQNADVIMLLKITSYYLNYKIFMKVLRQVNTNVITKITKQIILICVGLFFIVYFFSFIMGKVSQREIGFFEHVNLLGNIIVFLALAVIYFDLGFKYKLAIFLMGLLSMSTGSLLLSMLVFVPFKYLSVKNLPITFLLGTLVGLTFFFVSKIAFPDLHTKIFGIFSILNEYSLADFAVEVKKNTSLKEINESVESSLVWRLYAWIKYYYAFIESSLFALFFGHGLLNYQKVWNEIMPHNDFILILYDFGLYFCLIISPFFIKFVKASFNNKIIFFVGAIFLTRLFVENVIYSYYTFNIFIIQLALIKSHYDKTKSMRYSNVPIK